MDFLKTAPYLLLTMVWVCFVVCFVAYLVGVYLLGVYVSVLWAQKRFKPLPIATLAAVGIGIVVLFTGAGFIVGVIQNISDLMPGKRIERV